jgi:predicted RNA methylase
MPHPRGDDVSLPGIDMEPALDRLALSQWHTPHPLALRMAKWCGGIRSHRILEPSAGGGALVRAAIECGANPSAITAIELDPRWAKKLDTIERVEVEARDYLMRPAREHRYDLTLMNPPYEDGLDGRFLEKAMNESDRVVALIRTVALNGDDRYRRVWRRCNDDGDFGMVGLAVLANRPDFGGEHGAMADFVVIKIVRRTVNRIPSARVEWWGR